MPEPTPPGPPSDLDGLLRRALGGALAPTALRERIARALDVEDRRRPPRPGGAVLAWFRNPVLVAGLAASLLVLAALPWAGSWLMRGPLAAFSASRHLHLVGLVICVECARAGLPLEHQIHCREASHHNGLLLPGRAVWRLQAGGGAAGILEPDLRGREVSVEGDFVPGSEALQVVRFARL